MDRIKCLYNYPFQVLTNAPALYSFAIYEHRDVADILQFLFHIRDLRQLIIKDCSTRNDSNCLLTDIVNFYPNLESLSLAGCCPFTSDEYCLIGHLKKLSELDLSNCEVSYVYVKL